MGKVVDLKRMTEAGDPNWSAAAGLLAGSPDKSPFARLASFSSGTTLFWLDLAALCLGWPLALAATGFPGAGAAARIAAVLIYPACQLAALYALGLYRRDTIIWTRRSLARLPLATGLGVSGAWILLSLFAGVLGAGPAPLPLLAAAACLGLCGIAARLAFHGLKRKGVLRRRLLVVGAGRRAWDLALMLRREGRNLRYEMTFLHLESAGDIDLRLPRDVPGCRVLHVSDRDILPVARRLRADQIAVAPDERRGMALEHLLACKTAGFPVMQYLTFVEREIRRIDVKRMEVGWLLYSDGFYFGALDRFLKRVLDVLVSAVLLALLSPALLAGMLMVRLGDPGPVFYRQDRITRGGARFSILKLRTMRVDAEAQGAVWAAQGDRRTTPAGKFLRRTRIDEIPQLLNVLAGEMSLVGPRPERPSFVRLLSEQIPLYGERHRVKAGLTGWAQVNYPYGASIDDARSKLSYDLYYVKNFSVLFDLLIILQTIRVVLWPGGVR